MSGRDIRAGKAYVEMYVNDSKMQRGLAAARRRLQSFGTTIAGVGKSFALMGGAITAPFVGAIGAASRMEETMNKFNVVFGSNAAAVKAWGDEFGSQVGRSKEQVASFLAGTQDLLVPIGFEPGAATKMSKDITKLAVDLASFNNMADADVLRDLHAALTGGGETMKKYGVIVSAAAVKQELLNMGMDPKKATEQQKALARMNIIMAGTTAAQGDAIRSSGSFANQMKALRGTIDDAAAAIGSALLPVVTPLVTWIAEVAKVAGAWMAENQGLVVTVAAIGAAVLAFGAVLVPVGMAISAIGSVLGAVSAVMTVFGAITATAAGPVILLTGLVLALGAALAYVTGAGEKFVNWAKGQFGSIFAGLDTSMPEIDNSEAQKALDDLKSIELDDGQLAASLDANTEATSDAAAVEGASAASMRDAVAKDKQKQPQMHSWGAFSPDRIMRMSAQLSKGGPALKAAQTTAKNTSKLVKLIEKNGLAFA